MHTYTHTYLCTYIVNSITVAALCSYIVAGEILLLRDYKKLEKKKQ